MFDPKSAYSFGNSLNSFTVSEYGEKSHVLYKVKTLTGKPYFIRVDEFENDLFFIKFYPTNYEYSSLKYKVRLGDVREFSRLIGTCINVAKSIQEKNPEAAFGFHGQWDNAFLPFVYSDSIVQQYLFWLLA